MVKTCTEMSKLPAFSNATHVEHALLRHFKSLQRGLQLLWGFQNVLLSEDPSSPVHAKGLLAPGLLEDMHCIVRVDVRCTPHMAGRICTNGYQTEIKGPPIRANLPESRANRKVILGIMVNFSIWKLRDLSVSSVSVQKVN